MSTPNKKQGLALKQLERIESLVGQKRFKEAFAALREIPSDIYSQIPSQEAALCRYLKGYVGWELGEKKSALAEAREALKMYLSLRDFVGIAKAENLVGSLLIDLGNLESAREHLKQAVAGFKFAGDLTSAAQALNQVAYLHYVKGELRLAVHYNREAKEYAVNAGDNYYSVILLGSLAAYQLFDGQWRRALENLRTYLAETTKMGDFYNLTTGLILSGYAKKLSGRFKEARDAYIDAIGVATKENLTGNLKVAYEFLASLCITEGRFAEAEDYLKKALEIGERVSPYGTIMTQCWRLRGDLHLAKKEYDQALKAYETCRSYLIKLPERLEEGAMYRGMGICYLHKDQLTTAQSCFRKALEIFEACENDWELAKTYLKAAENGVFALAEVRPKLTKAKEIFKVLEHPTLEKRVATLLESPSSVDRSLSFRLLKEKIEKEQLLSALEKTNWNKLQASKILGISESGVRWLIKRYGLDK